MRLPPDGCGSTRCSSYGAATKLSWCRSSSGAASRAVSFQLSAVSVLNSELSNQRYLDALSVVGESLPVRQVLDRLAKPVIHIGRPCRPLHAIEPSDATLLSAISRGEFLINGFPHRDLQPLLYPSAMENAATRRKISGKLSRQLRLLRAHGLIFRVIGTTLYRPTKRGLTVTAAVGKIRECDLLKLAA